MDGENLSAILWYTCVVVIQFGYQAINSAFQYTAPCTILSRQNDITWLVRWNIYYSVLRG